jgi:hypothetical protein
LLADEVEDADEIEVFTMEDLIAEDEIFEEIVAEAKLEGECDNPTRDNSVLSSKPLHLVIKR